MTVRSGGGDTPNDRLRFVTFTDSEALREHLDELNEAGERCSAAGIDVNRNPFLITLIGPYAESEHVMYDSPWQGDVDWRGGTRYCEECHAHVHGIEDIAYPATVVVSS